MPYPPITSDLLIWYATHARQLPWRVLVSPYRTFISEMMLQQTRVDTVIPYFERWMQRFPDIATLAAASEQDVLMVWEGLGYYSRARNLYKAARLIADVYMGEIPDQPSQLRLLPGIGAYTAGAIASIAFNQPVWTMDGNIRRVIARLMNIQTLLATPAFDAACQQALEELLPLDQAGDFNQALMDLGATLCLPKNPQCELCPVKTHCLAEQAGTQNELPLRKTKAAIPHYTVTAGVIRQYEKVLLCQRPEGAMLAGLWEFPGGKLETGETLSQALVRELQEELTIQVRVDQEIGVYDHAFTHFKITLHAFFCEILSGIPHPVEAQDMQWVPLTDLAQYPMGKVDRLIASQLNRL
jgi:A/G-specific adenine glycosylase